MHTLVSAIRALSWFVVQQCYDTSIFHFLQLILLWLWVGLVTHSVIDAQVSPTEEQIRTILADYDREASLLCNKNAKANWNVQTDVLNDTLVAEQVKNAQEKLFF